MNRFQMQNEPHTRYVILKLKVILFFLIFLIEEKNSGILFHFAKWYLFLFQTQWPFYYVLLG